MILYTILTTILVTSIGPTLKAQYKTPFSRIPCSILGMVCVIATALDLCLQQESTYRRKHQESNVFMHHLMQSGLKRSKVITLHAHRVIDPPVAVMKILKAVYASQVTG